MTTQTKTATKATKAKVTKTTKKPTAPIPNCDSDSPTFHLNYVDFVTPDGRECSQMILGGATYWDCWQLWVVRGGMKDDRLFIAHASDLDRRLPIPGGPREFGNLDFSKLADSWNEIVNSECVIADEEPAPIFTRREEFYLCEERGKLFGPANYFMCHDVGRGFYRDKLKIVHKNRMSRALPFPKTEKAMKKLRDTWGKKQVATK